MKKLWMCIVVGFISILVTSFSYACVGARPMGMGGAFIGVADDANTTYWNPAGLSQIENVEVTYTPTIYNRDEYNYDDFVSIVSDLRIKERDFGGLGFSFVNSGYSTPLYEWTDSWYWLSYGVETFDNLSLGTNLRYKYREITVHPLGISGNDDGFEMDLSLLWRVKKFSFGLLYQNINEPNILGLKEIKNLRPGIAYRPDDKTVIALDMYDATGETDGTTIDVSQDLRFGIERWLTENFVLRAGAYHFNSDTDAMKAVTFGAGLKGSPESDGFLSNAQLDYSLLYWTDAASGTDEFTHQIGLTFRF